MLLIRDTGDRSSSTVKQFKMKRKNSCIIISKRQLPYKIILIIFIFSIIYLFSNIIIPFLLNIPESEVPGWGVNVSRNVSKYVFPNKQTAITNLEKNFCSVKKPLVVIIVCSNIRNTRQRKAIRETWATDARFYNSTVLFLIGRSRDQNLNKEIEEESSLFKDIIAEHILDTYRNLTLKSILMLKWITTNCMDARFAMKIDDDAYLNIKNLHKYVTNIEDEEWKKCLTGCVEYNPAPDRSRFSKWYMPTYIYPEKSYPDYIHGVGYLMSTYVANKLYHQSLQTDMIHAEDVYLTGICAQKINIPPIDHEKFHFYEEPVIVRCNSAHTHFILLSHHVHSYYMRRIYEQLMKC